MRESASPHSWRSPLAVTLESRRVCLNLGAVCLGSRVLGQPLALKLWVHGDGQGAWLRARIRDGKQNSHLLDLVRKVREHDANVGIVVLTMYAGDEQLFEALEAGVPAELVGLGLWAAREYCSTPARALSAASARRSLNSPNRSAAVAALKVSRAEGGRFPAFRSFAMSSNGRTEPVRN